MIQGLDIAAEVSGSLITDNQATLATHMTGVVFNIMRFSVHDGPGIRTAVFLKGCPLRCWWCHNPESQSFQPGLMLFEERCRQCGECVPVCPHGGIADPALGLKIPEACDACAACVETCVAGAREMAGQRMSVAEVVAAVERDVVFFDEAGGGVTLTGGEPASQPDFAEAVLRACRERGIHTALDTCGAAPAAAFARVSAAADLVLFDLKLMSPDRHADYTGAPNDVILSNLQALAAAGQKVVVRFPMIPGINDGPEEIEALLEILRRNGLRRVDLLPYHRIGMDKYKRLGMECRMNGVMPPEAERVAEIAAALRNEGLTVGIGGSR
jgi:pyruvate formate lyase activating enzyme